VRKEWYVVVAEETDRDWEDVYRENVGWIYRLMYRKVGNRPDAEDLTTEVFLAALPPLRLGAAPGEVRTYLRATTRSVLAAYWRASFGREATVIDLLRMAENLPRDGNSEETPRSDAPERAERILSRMPERYRRILQLRFLHTYSIREAAAELGVTVGNAKVLQHRALRLAVDVAKEMEGSA
jgi:RNA polymerase sigma factor (sigma-70 family)